MVGEMERKSESKPANETLGRQDNLTQKNEKVGENTEGRRDPERMCESVDTVSFCFVRPALVHKFQWAHDIQSNRLALDPE